MCRLGVLWAALCVMLCLLYSVRIQHGSVYARLFVRALFRVLGIVVHMVCGVLQPQHRPVGPLLSRSVWFEV